MKKASIYIAFGLLLLSPVAGFCQYSLSGKVLDNQTKKPVEYASLLLVEKGLQVSTNKTTMRMSSGWRQAVNFK